MKLLREKLQQKQKSSLLQNARIKHLLENSDGEVQPIHINLSLSLISLPPLQEETTKLHKQSKTFLKRSKKQSHNIRQLYNFIKINDICLRHQGIFDKQSLIKSNHAYQSQMQKKIINANKILCLKSFQKNNTIVLPKINGYDRKNIQKNICKTEHFEKKESLNKKLRVISECDYETKGQSAKQYALKQLHQQIHSQQSEKSQTSFEVAEQRCKSIQVECSKLTENGDQDGDSFKLKGVKILKLKRISNPKSKSFQKKNSQMKSLKDKK